MCLRISYKKKIRIFFLLCILKSHWRKESDPELDPDPLVRGTVGIRTKMSRITNTAKQDLPSLSITNTVLQVDDCGNVFLHLSVVQGAEADLGVRDRGAAPLLPPLHHRISYLYRRHAIWRILCQVGIAHGSISNPLWFLYYLKLFWTAADYVVFFSREKTWEKDNTFEDCFIIFFL